MKGQKSINFKQINVFKDTVTLGMFLGNLVQPYYRRLNFFVKAQIQFALAVINV